MLTAPEGKGIFQNHEPLCPKRSIREHLKQNGYPTGNPGMSENFTPDRPIRTFLKKGQ
jgi:hypothetical protein